MMPQLLLGDVVGEVCEIEGRNILVVPPFCSSVVMLTPFPFSGECPSGILTKPHSVSLDSLATIPISLPPSVSLSTHILSLEVESFVAQGDRDETQI